VTDPKTQNRPKAHQLRRMASNKNEFNFTGKVALVTGGGAGIGRATSVRFARHGAKVVIGDINPAGVETANLIKREKGEAIFVQTDVRKAKEVENLVATAVETYGGLHCAFNNAGILPPTIPLAEVDDSTFDNVLAVDLKGIFLSMKYEIRQMLQTGGGAIVNNASIAGMIAEAGISTYAAAKHGVMTAERVEHDPALAGEVTVLDHEAGHAVSLVAGPPRNIGGRPRSFPRDAALRVMLDPR